jgi:HPt (histidine-containing phosphotransfer) domain-containing protein
MERYHQLASEPGRTQPANGDSPTFNRSQALRNVGGSDAVLAEMIELFLIECPKQMSGIEAAYASGIREDVMRSAHTLKGSASLLAAEAVFIAARSIEVLGRDAKLDDFPEAWTALQRHIGELLQALRGHASASK